MLVDAELEVVLGAAAVDAALDVMTAAVVELADELVEVVLRIAVVELDDELVLTAVELSVVVLTTTVELEEEELDDELDEVMLATV